MALKTIAKIYHNLLKLRYKIIIKNAEVLKSKQAKLFLPNHQAVVDPQILVSYLLQSQEVAPAITERYFKSKLLAGIFHKLGAVKVPDLAEGSSDTEVLNKLYQGMVGALKDGRNTLVYPSGQTVGQGYEKIFNKQSAHLIVSNLPSNARVIGVRIGGLWGSLWSRAWEGTSPDFAKTFLKGLAILFANFIFFVPKRKITIEFEDITEEAIGKSKEGRTEFNNYLESFYNIHGEEPVYFKNHFFYLPKLKRRMPDVVMGSVQQMKSSDLVDVTEVESAVLEKVKDVLKSNFDIIEEIDRTSHLYLDLGIDSLGAVTLADAIKEAFPDSEILPITEIKTVADVCLFIQGKSIEKIEYKASILEEHSIPISKLIINRKKNILENYISTFTSHNDMPFTFDATSGSTRRKDFFLKSLVVGELLKKTVKGANVGIMLPALQSTSLLLASSYIAKKVPVMFNWTVGPKILKHCVDTSGVETIITASAFFNRIKDQIPEELHDKFVFLDKKVPEIPLGMKLKGLLKAKLPFLINTAIPDTAVILFTSGSESMPKAVPLSQVNITANVDDLFVHLDIPNDTIFLSFLPPFHSFGYTVLCALPLMSGAKIAYTPDPTNIKEVMRIFRHVGAHMVLGTPTFLRMMLSNSRPNDFKKVRYAISGAEKMPVDVKDRFTQVNDSGLLIEGYGITECSPVISANPLDKQKLGSVGKVLPSLDVKIVDLDSNEILPHDKEGMILVHGDSVFNCYLDNSIQSPFVELEEKQYYKTGDLGYFDSEGYLFITGRLKRFVKVAGEMISLPFIEGVLNDEYPSDEYVLAIEGKEEDGKASLVLFTTLDLDLNATKKLMLSKGVSPLAKLVRIEKVDEIPLLGTGKIDYKNLKDRV